MTPEKLPSIIRHWIGGELVDAVDGRTFDVSDPVSNTPYAQAARGTAADVDRAVAAASAAFPQWAGLSNLAGAAQG